MSDSGKVFGKKYLERYFFVSKINLKSDKKFSDTKRGVPGTPFFQK